MKRIFIALISLCTIVSAYAQGTVVEIWTASQLAELRDAVNAGTNTYEGKTVKLMADLDLGDKWIPIGATDNGNLFKGTFDGQGYTIEFDAAAPSNVLGLFGYLHSDGIVQHLKVDGNITNTSELTSSTAGIAGYNRGTISECANLAHIIGTTAGGIAGENHGKITNCYNLGNILAAYGLSEGNYHLGGIAGAIDANEAEISNVYVSCMITDINTPQFPNGIVQNKIKGELKNFFYYVLLDGDSDYYIGNVGTPITSFEGTILDGKLNADDYSIWTFTEGQLPELTCFKNKIVRLVDNSDNSVAISCNAGETCTVELTNRILYKDGNWNTLCLPFDLTINGSLLDGDGVTAKILDPYSTILDGTKLTLVFDNAPATILAGTPFIIKWKNTGVHLSNVQFNNVEINKTAPTPVTFSTGCQFVGTYSPFSIGDTSKGYDGDINEIILLSSDNTLGYSKNPRTLRSCRAHFMIPTTSSGIRAMMDFDIDFDDEEVTAIANLKSQISSLKPESWFTLQGVKLDSKPTQRGIYLHNGRKEAIR